MVPNRREVLKAVGVLAASASPLGWLLRWRPPRHHPDMFRLIGNRCPGFWLRVLYRGRSERWEIYADADRKRLLAAETFEAPALPRLSATHGGFTVTAAKSPDGWLETLVTRRRWSACYVT